MRRATHTHTHKLQNQLARRIWYAMRRTINEPDPLLSMRIRQFWLFFRCTFHEAYKIFSPRIFFVCSAIFRLIYNSYYIFCYLCSCSSFCWWFACDRITSTSTQAILATVVSFSLISEFLCVCVCLVSMARRKLLYMCYLNGSVGIAIAINLFLHLVENCCLMI